MSCPQDKELEHDVGVVLHALNKLSPSSDLDDLWKLLGEGVICPELCVLLEANNLGELIDKVEKICYIIGVDKCFTSNGLLRSRIVPRLGCDLVTGARERISRRICLSARDRRMMHLEMSGAIPEEQTGRVYYSSEFLNTLSGRRVEALVRPEAFFPRDVFPNLFHYKKYLVEDQVVPTTEL